VGTFSVVGRDLRAGGVALGVYWGLGGGRWKDKNHFCNRGIIVLGWGTQYFMHANVGRAK
jgi:hypothetical protein